MVVIGWRTGTANIKTGGGYGLRIKISDRTRYFCREWKSVKIEFDTGEIHEVNISRAFWGNCCELRSRFIGRWMIHRGLLPWNKSAPPHFRLRPIEGNVFKLYSI